jgi:hypothetical protein
MSGTSHKVIHGTMAEIEAIISELEMDGWKLVSVVPHGRRGKFTAFFEKAKGMFK